MRRALALMSHAHAARGMHASSTGQLAASAVAAQPCAAATSQHSASAPDSGVLVLGGGVVGMGVAFQLLRAGYKHVTIVADKFSPNTTSDVAGASIVPYTDSQDPVEHARVLRWTKETSDFLSRLRHREGSHASGVSISSSYEFWPTRDYPDAFWASAMQGFRRVGAEECAWLVGEEQAGRHGSAWAYTTLTLHVTTYLSFLARQVRDMGGRMESARIESLSQLRAAMHMYNDAHAATDREGALQRLATSARSASSSSSSAAGSVAASAVPVLPPLPAAVHALLASRPHSFVVNATGLGSKWLVPDPGVVGCKGVVLRVAGCPAAMQHCYSADHQAAYIIPRISDAIVGGTYGIADYSLEVDAAQKQRILREAATFVPDIPSAPTVDALTGTRPWRSQVRLELVRGQEPAQAFPEPIEVAGPPNNEAYSLLTPQAVESMRAEEQQRRDRRSAIQRRWDESDPKVPVIHAYGHGGSGITLHMGCAIEVLQLARDIVPPPAAATDTAATAPHLPSRL